MSVFFNGRLWTSPATMSAVNDSAMANQNLSVGNIAALIGASTAGTPNTPLVFGSPSQAQAVLQSGELLTAVLKAFNPSSQTGGPATVIAVRVNPAVQASLTLVDGSANPVITLVTQDYGQYTNQIKFKIETGSLTGKKLTAQLVNNYFTADNVARNALTMQYTGANASARVSVSTTTMTLESPNGSSVAIIDLNVYKTVQQLNDRINSVAGFTSTVSGGNGQTAALNGLDTVTLQDVKSAPFVVTANLQAIIDWINGTGEQYLTATRVASVGTIPVNIPFTYMSGGSDGVITNTQWSNAFQTMQTVDAQWIVPVSSDPSIAAMADSHVQFMSTVGRMERRAIVGTPLGTPDATALTLAMALNSDRTALIHLGYYDYDAYGNLALMPPYMTAALAAGMFSGVSPGTPLTNKSIKVSGLERNLRNPTDTDPLILGGVFCVESTSKGYVITKSISTWLTNTNYNRVEMSTGVALDFVARNVRNALDVLRGQKMSPTLVNRAVGITESALRALAVPDPAGPGVIVGNAASPAYLGITATAAGDVLSVSFQCSPVIPANYIPITIFAVPFSGSATAS